jgi:hypothetical protein
MFASFFRTGGHVCSPAPVLEQSESASHVLTHVAGILPAMMERRNGLERITCHVPGPSLRQSKPMSPGASMEHLPSAHLS